MSSGAPASADDAAQHVDEEAGQRQVRPGGVGGDVHEHEEPLAALGRGDDRRAVLQRRPGLACEIAVGLGQDLAADAEVGGQLEAVERALSGEGREGARRVPGQGAAEIAPAAPEAHGHELVVAGGEPRAGEAQEHAAALDEGRDLRQRVAVERAHIGEDEHRDLLVQQLRHRVRDAAAALAHFGVRRERAGDVVGRGEQRLRLVGRAAEDDADAPALAALVEQAHRSGGALAQHLDARDAVADFDRQLELRLRLRRAGGEGERDIGERKVFEIERAQGAGVAPVRLGAQDAQLERAGGVLRAGERQGRRALGLVQGHGAVRGDAGEALDESLAVNARDAIIDPYDFGVRRRAEEALERAQMRAAIGKMRLRPHGAQAFERGGRVERLQLGRLVGGRDDRDDPAFAPRRLDALDREAKALAPVVRGRKAVVEDEQHGRAAVAAAGRIEHRPGRGDDEERRDQEPEREQPPRRARRRLLLRQEIGEDAQRREVDAPRPRRRDAQDEPDHRQRDERGEHERRGKGERKPQHRQLPMPAALNAVPRAAATRVMRRSAASLAGRSVRWIVRVQPRWRTMSESASRCSFMRSR